MFFSFRSTAVIIIALNTVFQDYFTIGYHVGGFNRRISRFSGLFSEEPVSSTFSPSSLSLPIDIEYERDQLNQLKTEQLLQLAEKEILIDRSQLPPRVDLEEIKDNLLYRKLTKLSRSELKQIAKLYYIDLRSTSTHLCEQIIEQSRKDKNYLDTQSLPSDTATTPSNSTNANLQLDKEDEEALREQGLNLQDLLRLQVQFQQHGPAVFIKRKNYASNKRFSSNQERKVDQRSGPKNTTASWQRHLLAKEVFEGEDDFPTANFSAPFSRPDRQKQNTPLIIGDDELEKLPRKKLVKDIPDLGKILTAPKSDLLHGVSLKQMIEQLVERIGFDGLYQETHLKFLQQDPSVTTLLKLLRNQNMEWARRKVERLYIRIMSKEQRFRSR